MSVRASFDCVLFISHFFLIFKSKLFFMFLAIVLVILAKSDAIIEKSEYFYLSKLQDNCNGKIIKLNDTKGYFHTPNFPHIFPVPINCKWLIEIPSPDKKLFVYFTQFFLKRGLHVYECNVLRESECPSENYLKEVMMDELSNSNVDYIEIRNKRYILLNLNMDHIQDSHLRVWNSVIDFYGFNITYEIVDINDNLRANFCALFHCTFLGHCYVKPNFEDYYCDCFPGFRGDACQYGDLCDPQLNKNQCFNQGKCSYYGSHAIICECPDTYSGGKCENKIIHQVEKECEFHLCSHYCVVNKFGMPKCLCETGFKLREDNLTCIDNGEVRYFGKFTLKLPFNSTWLLTKNNDSNKWFSDLKKQLKTELDQYFRALPIGDTLAITELRIINNNEFTMEFYFIEDENSYENVSIIMKKIAESKKLANMAVYDTYTLENVPLLRIQDLKFEEQFPLKGSMFTLMCEAKGSDKLKFSWFKDEFPINISKTQRSMWENFIPNAKKNQITALLNIEKLSSLDKGAYTCQVSDRGQVERRVVYVNVIGVPVVKIVPLSKTVEYGSSLKITCMFELDNTLIAKYYWKRNGLFLVPGENEELVETVRPSGSILKILHIKNSSAYTCVVQNDAAETDKQSIITVLKGDMMACEEEYYMGIYWNRTAEGTKDIHLCPPNFKGEASRECERKDLKVYWKPPDFSQCISMELDELEEQFNLLKFGYQVNTSSAFVKALKDFILKKNVSLHSKEGSIIIELLQDLWLHEKEFPAADTSSLEHIQIYLQIIMFFLENIESLSNSQEMDCLLNQLMIYNTENLSKKYSHKRINIKFMTMDIALRSFSPNLELQFPLMTVNESLPEWVTDDVSVSISAIRQESKYAIIHWVDNLSVAVTFYKNLMSLIPDYQLLEETSHDVITNRTIKSSCMINSKIISLNMKVNEDDFIETDARAIIELNFYHLKPNITGWNISCVVLSFNDRKVNWSGESCFVVSSNSNSTKCHCFKSGMFAVMLQFFPLDILNNTNQFLDVTIFLSSSVSLILLFLSFCIFTFCKSFVKFDFFSSVIQICIILIFINITYMIASIHTDLEMHVMEILVCFLYLIAYSLMMVISVQAYLALHTLPVFKQSNWKLFILAWGIPSTLIGILILLSYNKEDQSSLWLIFNSFQFSAIITAAVFLTLVYLFFVCLIMYSLNNKSKAKTENFNRTYCLSTSLWKSFSLLTSIWISVIFGVFWINNEDSIYKYFFAISNCFTSLLTFLCYCGICKKITFCSQVTLKSRKKLSSLTSTLENSTTDESCSTRTTEYNSLAINESFKSFMKPDLPDDDLHFHELLEKRSRIERVKRMSAYVTSQTGQQTTYMIPKIKTKENIERSSLLLPNNKMSEEKSKISPVKSRIESSHLTKHRQKHDFNNTEVCPLVTEQKSQSLVNLKTEVNIY